MSVSLAAFGVRDAAHALRAAQEKARKAIAKAKDARDAINQANDDIDAAQTAEGIATDRMFSALRARDAATTALANDLSGSGVAMAALQQADTDYENAHRDLLEAQRAEARARDRLHDAQEDLKAARKQGADAADDAQDAGLLLQGSLAGMPAGVYAMPGVPARSSLTDAAGIPRPQPVRVNVPLSQREPPSGWPGWAKTLFKVGRGEYTTVDGTVHTVKSGVEHPDKIPGALKNLGEHPLGTAKGLVGYDDLANGRYADWFGSMGITFLAAGAGTGPARLSRLRRITGDPDLVPLGTRAPVNGAKFAGSKVDFTREDFGRRPGTTAPKISERGAPGARGEVSGRRQVHPRGLSDLRPVPARQAGASPTASPVDRRATTRPGQQGGRTAQHTARVHVAPHERRQDHGARAHRPARQPSSTPAARRRSSTARSGRSWPAARSRRASAAGRSRGGVVRRHGLRPGRGAPMRIELREPRPPVSAEELAAAERELAALGRIDPAATRSCWPTRTADGRCATSTTSRKTAARRARA